MKIIIHWSEGSREDLVKTLKLSLDELWLVDFINIEETNDSKVKEEMWIKQEPALIIEEESIDFKDMIFEWQTPPDDEIKAMLISIIWWESGGWSCGSLESDWSCGTGCSCW